MTLSPSTALDELILGFVHDYRRQPMDHAGRGVLDVSRVNLAPLFHHGSGSSQSLPGSHPYAHQHQHQHQHQQSAKSPFPCVGDLVRTLLDVAGMTRHLERLAAFALMKMFVSWVSHPNHQTQSQVASHYKPRPSQLSIEHPAWIDLILWGGLRDIMINHQGVYATEEFQRVYSSSMRLVNWPPASYGGARGGSGGGSGGGDGSSSSAGLDAAVVTDPVTGQAYLSDALMAHASRPENWAVTPSFTMRYPELRGFVPLLP